jgi:hypothetical protein
LKKELAANAEEVRIAWTAVGQKERDRTTRGQACRSGDGEDYEAHRRWRLMMQKYGPHRE